MTWYSSLNIIVRNIIFVFISREDTNLLLVPCPLPPIRIFMLHALKILQHSHNSTELCLAICRPHFLRKVLVALLDLHPHHGDRALIKISR